MKPGELSRDEIDALLNRAAYRARRASERAVSRAREAVEGAAAPAADAGEETADLPPEAAAFEGLLDLPLDVRVRLGEAEMSIQDVLSIRDGSVVELDRAPGDPVDVLVNDRPFARGRIEVVEDRIAVRVTEILAPPHAVAPRRAGAGEVPGGKEGGRR
jgi:flagellar motor switch protein FliN/FliY